MRFTTTLKYSDRAGKARYIADKYAPLLTGTILDVGCDTRQLALALPDRASGRYTGVDLNPAADLILNLDTHDLPFPPRSFDTVVCTDVLEHLERLHHTFDALCTIARAHLIISLPGCLRCLLLDIAAGTGGRMKFYGLPLDPPPDRHRWFFGYEEAADFLRLRGQRHGFSVTQMEPEERGCPEWLNSAGANLTASDNIRFGTIWCVLSRTA